MQPKRADTNQSGPFKDPLDVHVHACTISSSSSTTNGLFERRLAIELKIEASAMAAIDA